jgi:hypothetical protein
MNHRQFLLIHKQTNPPRRFEQAPVAPYSETRGVGILAHRKFATLAVYRKASSSSQALLLDLPLPDLLILEDSVCAKELSNGREDGVAGEKTLLVELCGTRHWICWGTAGDHRSRRRGWAVSAVISGAVAKSWMCSIPTGWAVAFVRNAGPTSKWTTPRDTSALAVGSTVTRRLDVAS